MVFDISEKEIWIMISIILLSAIIVLLVFMLFKITKMSLMIKNIFSLIESLNKSESEIKIEIKHLNNDINGIKSLLDLVSLLCFIVYKTDIYDTINELVENERYEDAEIQKKSCETLTEELNKYNSKYKVGDNYFRKN